MSRRVFPAMFALLALFLVGLAPVASAQDSNQRGRKYKPPPPTARIEVTVLNNANGKPIENAAVVFHPMKGDKDEGDMELKTNEDGKTVLDVIPIGDSVQVQIIAHGFQTYGQEYKVDKDHLAIDVKLKRPGEQYTIYKNRAGDKKDQNQPQNPDKPQQ
ncbi:MAG: hypothetical protein WCF17_12430 [Terracidiphilus sp.]